MQASLVEALNLIENAKNLLMQAEGIWPDVFEKNFGSYNFPEVTLLEELLHISTHEESSTLVFLLQDINALLSRITIKAKYKIFNQQQFQLIISTGWSVKLAKTIHSQLPEHSLFTVSEQIKSLCNEWSVLPKIMCSIASKLENNANELP